MSEDMQKFVKVIGTAGVILLGWLFYDAYKSGQEVRNASKKEAVCPALLSIGRSSRDTMIVMKAEPLCNDFVLENLK